MDYNTTLHTPISGQRPLAVLSPINKSINFSPRDNSKPLNINTTTPSPFKGLTIDKKYSSQVKYPTNHNIRIIGKNEFSKGPDYGMPLPKLNPMDNKFRSINNERKMGGGAKTCMSRNQKIKTHVPVVPLNLN